MIYMDLYGNTSEKSRIDRESYIAPQDWDRLGTNFLESSRVRKEDDCANFVVEYILVNGADAYMVGSDSEKKDYSEIYLVSVAEDGMNQKIYDGIMGSDLRENIPYTPVDVSLVHEDLAYSLKGRYQSRIILQPKSVSDNVSFNGADTYDGRPSPINVVFVPLERMFKEFYCNVSRLTGDDEELGL